jgi:hypothetical protein
VTNRAAHIPDIGTGAADPVEAGLRRVLAVQRMAERALVEGDADEKAVAAALLNHLDRPAEGPLEAALGLSGPGHTGALRQYRQDRRDAALRRIWHLCWPDLNAGAAARMIARHWAQFAARRNRQSPAGSISADEPDATLRWLCDRGHIALSPDRLRRVLCDDQRQIGRLHRVETTNGPGDGDSEDGE